MGLGWGWVGRGAVLFDFSGSWMVLGCRLGHELDLGGARVGLEGGMSRAWATKGRQLGHFPPSQVERRCLLLSQKDVDVYLL